MKTRTQKENAASKATRRAITREQIQKRAHEIFIAHGQKPGRALDDWLQAERELKGGNHPPSTM